MYSNKENVNILTSLLVAHGISHAVVCPGSRNAPIVHNLNECPDITCFPVTDERSAGFYALGLAHCLEQPVVVCVTSGTALLNLAPAVAEAYYQHVPVVVVSADRPPQWIDQLDGQTLPQPDALGRFVGKAVNLPEPHDEETRWYCNRLVNEALIVRHAPVHINVPISEPLFEFTTEELPVERRIELLPTEMSRDTLEQLGQLFMQSPRPMLITGQPFNLLMELALYYIGDDERYVPDLVVCTDGCIVSKELKHFLRKAKETWIVNETGEVHDTFMNLTRVVQGDGKVVADYLRSLLEEQPHPFLQLWQEALQRARKRVEEFEPRYSQMAVMKYFESHVGNSTVYYGNSSAIRLANLFASDHPVFCNRGVNGIEGTLSTAAGHSLGDLFNVYCVIGDLSFFYDQNALWNQNLQGRRNLRIILLNNGGGGIFRTLPGLKKSPAFSSLIAAEHLTTAQGICCQHEVVYMRAENMEQMKEQIDDLFYETSTSPVVLEVFTDSADDEAMMFFIRD